MTSKEVLISSGKKFDLQLSQALMNERGLARLLGNGKIELKSESWQWEQTGNICIEYLYRGAPSGIAVTEADVWVHELKRSGATLMHLFLPVPRLKDLCRIAIKAGKVRHNAGDDGHSSVVLLRIADLLH